MDYNAPSGSTDPNAPFVGKTASTIGSKVPPRAAEHPQREIVNAEKAAGLTPSGSDTTQLAQSIGRGLWIGTLGANPNTLVGALGGGVTPSAPAILQTLQPWTKFRGLALQTNTAVDVAVTISGIGSSGGVVTAPLRKRDGVTKPAVGDVPTLWPFDVQWDGAVFRFVGAAPSEGGGGGLGSLTPDQLFKTFRASGTYTIPARSVEVWMTGAGGGGNTSLGGGAGAELVDVLTGLTVGNTLTVGIGLGGTGSTSSTGGGNGGDTVVSSGTQTISTRTAGGGRAPVAGSGIAGLGGVASVTGTPSGVEILSQGNGGSSGVGGTAQPFAPFGDGGSTALNGVVVNGATISNQAGAQGIVLFRAVAS